MRNTLLLTALSVLVSAPALAWVPKLEDTTTKAVIDSAYGRRDPVSTYLTLDLGVQDGKFKAGDGVVRAFDGGDACVTDWLAKPADFSGGSRLASMTLSGQADQLFFQAQEARDSFKNLSVKDALAGGATRLPDGQLRVDMEVRGLPSEKARSAYLVRLKGPDGKLIAPVKTSYVNDWKQEEGGWHGTLVYYFEPLKAGLGASDKVDFLVRTEADTSCAYAVTADLSKFN
ncbi:hypothetical protein [Deinococcus maricopensis]|uniref:Uncharacterized protein n=1 Tax=Deinococcus maricopensis (strain DSM 21211 / LMG 22137 / NRRL B-23946 / LB-34) TaxID=709986 RepID=E8UA19_DEIML|nr:hypothetical protein [Deinococcus maricopensis]ADV67908.1 hypothetical protein Deima_2270 [Deinococcus maricopensis DSM 21211]